MTVINAAGTTVLERLQGVRQMLLNILLSIRPNMGISNTTEPREVSSLENPLEHLVVRDPKKTENTSQLS